MSLLESKENRQNSRIRKAKERFIDLPIRELFFLIFNFLIELFLLFGNNNYNFDEILLVFSILSILIGVFKGKRNFVIFAILMVFLFLSGCVPFLRNEYNRQIMLVLTDFIMMFKFLFYFFGVLFWADMIIKKINIRRVMKLNYYLLFALCIFATLIILYQKFVIGISRPSVFADYNGYPALFFVFTFLYVMASIDFNIVAKKNIINILLIFLCVLNILLITNTTAIITFCLIVLIYIFSRKKISKIIIFLLALIFILLVLIIFRDKLSEYFLDINHPRYLLYYHSIMTCLNFFPFGVGLSLYGTTVAAVNYSPYYLKIGFDNIYGMSADNTIYLLDAYYPGVIGEFGFIGALLFIILLVFMGSILLRISGKKKMRIVISCISILLLNAVTFNILNTLISFTVLFYCIIFCRYYDLTIRIKKV